VAVDLFIQGLRRSSTTFLFDVLLADPRFVGWYEPLAAAKVKAVGGGSRMSDVDFYEALRDARARFAAQSGLADPDVLNHGAPRRPELELDSDLPGPVAAYVNFLCDEAEFTVLKFVRAWRKLPALVAARPTAKIVHIVRDPRAVVTSFLFGKGRKNAARYDDAAAFFEQHGPAKGNQGLAIADALIASGELTIGSDDPHALKLLGVWQHHFRSAHRDGLRLGAARYLLLRHEDLLAAPLDAIGRVYRLIGEDVPQSVTDFLTTRLDPRPRIHEPEDPRWTAMFERLALAPELLAAGYPEIAGATTAEETTR
jgi:hypothetical protein